MKRYNILAIGTCALAMLASCEMKEELWGNKESNADGNLQLTVAVKEPVSMTRAVETANFPVIIEGTAGSTSEGVRREFAASSEVPANLPLSIGTYTVTAHTAGTIEKKMTAPYYYGSNSLEITKNVTTQAKVTCKMKNSRIQLIYGDKFESSFNSWIITIDDGSNTALSFNKTDNRGEEPIYWYFDEETVSQITVNVKAVTIDGNSITSSYTYKKKDATGGYEEGVSDFFSGGDALKFNFDTTESLTGTVTGITVQTNISFEDYEESVEIPAYGEEEGGGEEPSEPTENLSIAYENDKNVISYPLSTPPASADVTIKAKNGIQSITVKITAGCDGFETILNDLKMDEQSFLPTGNGVDIVNNGSFNTLLNSVFNPSGPEQTLTPQVGNTEYIFKVGAFFSFLNITGATTREGGHQFNILVTDKKGETVEGQLYITITE